MSKHKLLLADDSITIQKVVNLTFADEGIEVISVGDGNSAMEKFEEFTPDLVMADINMPGLSGYEICERIKQNEATRGIPVILLVGSFEPFDEAEAQRVGANDYLTKPFQSIRQLVSKVSDLLNSSTNGEEIEDATDSFHDTLEMNRDLSDTSELGDAGMDDEMIQANQVGSFQFDETHKFESHNEPEFEDSGKTQPLSAAEFDEINAYPTQEPTDLSDHQITGFTGQEENEAQEVSGEETQEFSAADESGFSAQTEDAQPSPMFERSSNVELDDMNLLELPPRRSFTAAAPPTPPAFEDNFTPSAVETIEPEAETSTETSPETGDFESTETQEKSDFETVETKESAPAGDAGQITNLSPEIIDAIAAKVVEKISDQVIREIAWEVVPQMTDLIVKRLAEEKLRE